jgi:hypothetical protein
MNMDDLISQFTEDLTFDALLVWADILKIEHNHEQWLDDDYPEKESELRTAMAEAMERVGK